MGKEEEEDAAAHPPPAPLRRYIPTADCAV